MEIDAYIINLAAKKLAGEATDDELSELNTLLAENKTLDNLLKNIFASWDKIDFGNNLSDQEMEQNLNFILKKIQHKINPGGNLSDEPLKDC
jgi:hypothetical protein